jgi:hypothetical protein
MPWSVTSNGQHGVVFALRVAIALVWLTFGLLFKALDLLPRHRRIVARVVGARQAGKVLWLVASAEVGIGIWVLVGRYLVLCMAVQTLLLASMNVLELRHARDLLLSPRGMLCANAVLLTLGWYAALHGP